MVLVGLLSCLSALFTHLSSLELTSFTRGKAVPGLPTGHSPQPLLTSNAPLPLQRLIMGAAASLVDVYHVQNHPYYEVEKGGKPISPQQPPERKERKV